MKWGKRSENQEQDICNTDVFGDGSIYVSLLCCRKSGQSVSHYIRCAEIIVGKTQVGALYDIGCQVAITVGGSIAGTTNWTTSVLSQDMTLGKKTTSENFYIMKDGIKQASVNVTTKKAVPLKEAVIGELEIDTSVQPTEDITFDGIALSDLTQEKFLQKVADSVTEQDKAAASYSGNKYSVSATWNEDGSIATLQMKKNK